MNELFSMTATELSDLIKTRHVSPVELTEEMLERIYQLNPSVNAYITVTPEVAMLQAQEAESEIMSGNYRGSLHGIPVGIKDNYYTEGIRTTAGSKLLADYVPDKNATVVEKLSNAGAITLGKLNMHEFGGGLTNTNPFYGNARNPWNLQYSPGGSSGGSGAALAAGIATLTTGTDTFGSIRVPAAMCGIYGLKPTYGLVSTEGIAPLAWSLDHAGPMARSISDLTLMLQEMAGYDPEDPGSIKVPIPNYREHLNKSIKGIKIGVPTHYLEGLDHDVETLFFRALETFEELGAEVVEIEIPELAMSTFSGYVITTGEASTFHYEWLQQVPQDYAQDVRAFFEAGVLTNIPKYVRPQQARRVLVEKFKAVFEEVDILLGPTIPITTPKFEQNWVEQNLNIIEKSMAFTVPANLTGTPSLAVPMGLCSKGVPVGMQLIGDHFSEPMLFQVGSAWEKTNPLNIK